MTVNSPYLALSGHINAPDTRLLRRVLELVWGGIPIRGRSVLDIGGGSGLMSFYAASEGASRVVCLEPSEAGSNPRMEDQFLKWQVGLADAVQVDLVRDTIQNYVSDERFDIVLINSAINHIDEDACRRLPVDPEARARYAAIFEKLAGLTVGGGDLIIADAARRNLWGAFGLRSPFARTIEWDIHAQPRTWAVLASDAGFHTSATRWRAHARLGRIGQKLLGNPLGAWATNSMFVLQMRRTG